MLTRPITTVREAEDFVRAGPVQAIALNLNSQELPPGRQKHSYGDDPFAKLQMWPSNRTGCPFMGSGRSGCLRGTESCVPLKARLVLVSLIWRAAD